MSDSRGEVSSARPVLLGELGRTVKIKPTGGGSKRIDFADTVGRNALVDRRLQEAMESLNAEVELSASLNVTDPELVLVFEALDDHTDLAQVATSLGLEVLLESEGAQEPTDDFVLTSKRPIDPLIGSCLHALCMNARAFRDLQRHWATFKSTGQVPGLAPLRNLFDHLKDVRPWGPQDRLKHLDWDDYFASRIDTQPHTIEVELWYRQTQSARDQAEQSVSSLIRSAGGAVISTARIAAIGYHALKCSVGSSFLHDLADGKFDDVQVVKSANVMYLRVTGQSSIEDLELAETTGSRSGDLPSKPAILCLLDGVPESNHTLLSGRVTLYDPDDLAALSTALDRRHGTAMASSIIWGDLAEGGEAFDRQLFVRPILAPSSDTKDRVEEIPADVLTPDLMWRVFRELFEGTETTPPVAPDIAIVNLSVGDPTTVYDTAISSWARMIDWLSYTYGVLVVVSAGNHPGLPLPAHLNSRQLAALNGEERRAAVLAAQAADRGNRRLLSPAESINALTVGALHQDSSGAIPPGYRVDPTDGLQAVSPISALGGGYRRSIKPDVAAPGGKVTFQEPLFADSALSFSGGTSRGPGIRVAAPGGQGETHTVGTSPAAALVSRQAAALYETLQQLTDSRPLSRRQRAAAIKALMIHGAAPLPEHDGNVLEPERAHGHGAITRNFADGCGSNEAVVLYVGTIGAGEDQELLLPLPDGLSVRETKRISATLSWLSPTNWRHRQYRQAALSFAKPAGGIPKLGSPQTTPADVAKRGASTTQHLEWELESAFSGGKGSNMALHVKCFEQAGGLQGERIDFAVALSLWVAPTLGVDVYSQVRDQIRPRVPITPR